MKKIVDLSREEAIDIVLRLTKENIYNTGNIIVVDNVLSETECDWILNEMRKNEIEKYQFLSDDEYGYNIRGGKSFSLNGIPHLTQFIYEKFATKVYEVLKNNDHYSNFIESNQVIDLGYEYCRYESGEYLRTHADGHILQYGSRNFLSLDTEVSYFPFIFASVSLMLNTLENGGELIFPVQDQTIQQKAGRVVIWNPSRSFLHGTNPVGENSNRDVIVTWFALKNLVAVDPQHLISKNVK